MDDDDNGQLQQMNDEELLRLWEEEVKFSEWEERQEWLAQNRKGRNPDEHQ